jgi:DNA-binding transcriptional MerR regulator
MTSESLSADHSLSPPGIESDYFSIGDMARTFGVTLRALRFYEDRGLIQPMRVGALRLYDASARERLRTILKGKLLGFTLTEIRELLAASGPRSEDEDLHLAPNQIATQLSALEHRRAQIDEAIAELRSAAERLCAVAVTSEVSELAA